MILKNGLKFHSPNGSWISYNNFEISLVAFMPNITTNHAITYTNYSSNLVLFHTKLTWKAYATKHEWKINVWGCVEILPSIIQRRDGKHLPCKQRLHFRGVSWRVKKRPLLTTVQFSIVHAWNLSPDLQAKLIVRSVVKWRKFRGSKKIETTLI